MAENLTSPIDGYAAGCTPNNLVPESERPGRRYQNESRLSPRPKREALREQMADYVLLNLGAPTIEIELDSQQLSLCVDEALRMFEEYAPASHYQYFYFLTESGKSVYTMPPDVGLIRQVYWKTGGAPCDNMQLWVGGAAALPHIDTYGITDYGQFTGYMSPGPIYGRMGEWVQLQQYHETFRRLSSNNGGWEWAPENKIILYPNPQGSEWVIVHYLQRMKEWSEVITWMQDYALAQAKEILGRIRSKYATLPGPAGGVSLDGPSLIAEAREDKEKLRQELLDKYSMDHMYITTG